MNDIIIAKGLFSKVVITLNDDVHSRLVFKKKDNPLASVEQKAQKLLDEFETKYFETLKNDNQR